MPNGILHSSFFILHFILNLSRTLFNTCTSLIRAWHRHGFDVQSPWAYELVRDVLFEPLAYYAYSEQGLTDEWQRQLYRIRLRFKNRPLVVIDQTGSEAVEQYHHTMTNATPQTVIVVEHIDDANATLWNEIVDDPRTVVTFDMRRRGLVVLEEKRIKQNYLL